jgi:hypothetical protein
MGTGRVKDGFVVFRGFMRLKSRIGRRPQTHQRGRRRIATRQPDGHETPLARRLPL